MRDSINFHLILFHQLIIFVLFYFQILAAQFSELLLVSLERKYVSFTSRIRNKYLFLQLSF